MYRSGLEREFALFLTKRGVSFLYEPHTLDYTVPGKYKPDFLLPNGIYLEIKGVLNKYDDRETAKMIAVKKCNPDKDIRLVFADASIKIPRTKMTHARWADKHGYTYADGHIPEEWLR